MAAPPWTARTKWTLHWYSQGGCDHQWPIGQSPECPGKAAMSRAGVALLTWQPPPDVPGTDRPSIDIRRGAVIINGPSVSPQSAQGRLRCLEQEWLFSHGSPPLTCQGPTDPPLIFAGGLWSSMAHRSVSRVPREGCDVKSRSGSPHMAAPPWTARTKWTLHWYSQGGCDHQWPIGHSPESPGKAAMSRAGVALLTWQPPLTCQGPTDPPLIFAGGLWSSMAHRAVSRVPREGCDV